MGISMKRPVRDRLVNDATIRGFFTGVSTTATASVYPVYMEVTGRYPSIVYSEIYGSTDPGMSATNGIITFGVFVQATGGSNPHTQAENITERINQLFDDQVVTGVAISGTAVYSFLMLKDGGTDLTFNPERRVYQRFVSYSYKSIQN